MVTRDTTVRAYRDGQLVESRDVTYEVTVEQDNEETIRAAAANALATNRTFIALTSPTNAQVVAQVKALSRQMNGLVRLVNSQLDATD